MKKKGFTLIELLVVIAIIAMLLAILMPALNKVKKIAQRVVCGTNLKGLGTAQSVYSNDFEDQFTKQGGKATAFDWTRFTPGFDRLDRDWNLSTSVLSIGSSLYLLVREADVSPKSFVCGASGQTAYDGKNSKGLDLVQLWDFGNPNTPDASNNPCGKGPMGHVSYGFHQPYGSRAASGSSSSSFAIMADKNPWFDPKLSEMDVTKVTAENYLGSVARMGFYFDSNIKPPVERYAIQVANAYAHGREGQNVSFGDGHNEYVKTSDVGVKHDNIYTQQNGSSEQQIRSGLVPVVAAPKGTATIAGVEKLATYQPATPTDSYLFNDDDQL